MGLVNSGVADCVSAPLERWLRERALLVAAPDASVPAPSWKAIHPTPSIGRRSGLGPPSPEPGRTSTSAAGGRLFLTSSTNPSQPKTSRKGPGPFGPATAAEASWHARWVSRL